MSDVKYQTWDSFYSESRMSVKFFEFSNYTLSMMMMFRCVVTKTSILDHQLEINYSLEIQCLISFVYLFVSNKWYELLYWHSTYVCHIQWNASLTFGVDNQGPNNQRLRRRRQQRWWWCWPDHQRRHSIYIQWEREKKR